MPPIMKPATVPNRTTSKWPAMPCVPLAWGEVFDKLTILEIKAQRLAKPTQLANVARERLEIEAVVGDPGRFPVALSGLVSQLKGVNATLWEIEDGKRACERRQSFDAAFVQLARQVYRLNDQRAAIKRQINLVLGSTLLEEKSHQCD